MIFYHVALILVGSTKSIENNLHVLILKVDATCRDSESEEERKTVQKNAKKKKKKMKKKTVSKLPPRTSKEKYKGEPLNSQPTTTIDMKVFIPMLANTVQYFSTQHVPGDKNKGFNKAEAWRKTIKGLRNKYSKETAWIWPLEFIPATLLDKQYFLDPKLHCTDPRGVEKVGDDLELSELLSPVEAGGETLSRILIRGDSGFGKTTLCTMLAYFWARKHARFHDVSSFKLAIYYCLKDLPDDSTIEEALFKEVVHFSGQGTTKEEMLPIIEENSSEILILLDGYDELPKRRRELVHFFLHGDPKADHCSAFRAATIIVTTIPIHDDLEHFKSMDRFVEITGLSEENQAKFVKTLFPNEIDLYANLKEKLDKTELDFLPRLSPLMLYIICFLVHDKHLVISKTSPEAFSSHAIYEEICMLFGEKCNTTKKLNMADEAIKKAFFEIGKMLYHSSENNRPVYTASFHENHMIGEAKEYETFILNCGLVQRQTTANFRENTKVYKFIHPSFGAFLGGLYVSETVKRLSNDQEVMKFIGYPQVLSTTIHDALTQRSEPDIGVLSFAYLESDIVLKIEVDRFGEPNKLMKVEAFRKESYMKWANEAFLDVDQLLEKANFVKIMAKTKQHGRPINVLNQNAMGTGGLGNPSPSFPRGIVSRIEKIRIGNPRNNDDDDGEHNKRVDINQNDTEVDRPVGIDQNDVNGVISDDNTPVIPEQEPVLGPANMRTGIEGNDIKLLNDCIDPIGEITNN